MALITFRELFGSPTTYNQPTTYSEETGGSTWFASMLGDAKCCAMRDRSENLDLVAFPAAPIRRSLVEHDADLSARTSTSEMLGSHRALDLPHPPALGSDYILTPTTNKHQASRMPKDFVERISGLLSADPFIEREISERARGSLRSQFLHQCLRGNRTRCKEIWNALDERDRSDLMQAYNLREVGRAQRFFLNILEPEAWTDRTWRQGNNDFELITCHDDTDASSVSTGRDYNW